MTKSNKRPICYRQGDVLTIERDLPKSAKPVESEASRTVLKHGEVTGHAHAFYRNRAVLYRDDGSGGAVYVKLSAADDLKHEEHSTISHPPLGPGKAYLVPVQVEHSPRGLRQVAD